MQAKGNDAVVMFDGGWLTIVHSGLGAIARGGTRPKRVHVKNIASIDLTRPRLLPCWFTVVPADRVWNEAPVPPPHRDPYTVRFSRSALGDFEAIRFAVQEAMLAAARPHAESAAPSL